MDAANFASQQQLNEYRGLSRLNAELDDKLSLRSRRPYINPAAVKAPSSDNSKLGPEIFANLIIRDGEATAAILASKGGSVIPPEALGTISSITSPQIIIAATPTKEDDKFQTITPREQDQLRVEAKWQHQPLDTSRGVVPAVLDFYAQHNGCVSVNVHVGWSTQLLKKCHQENITPDAYSNARQDYRDYIYLASHAKMLTRLVWGQNKSNFYKILTTREEDYAAGSFDQPDINAKYSQLRPTPRQEGLIYQFVMNMARNHEDIPRIAKEKSTAPIYDVDGRKFFHFMLSTYVISAFQSLKRLSEKQGSFGGRKKNKKLSIREEDRSTMATLVRQAKAAVLNLYLFRLRFGKTDKSPDILSLHLAWLAREVHVTGRTTKPYFSNDSPEPEFIDIPEVEKEVAKEESDGEDQAAEDEEDDYPEQDETEEEFDHIIDSVSSPGVEGYWGWGWAAGALKYLDLVCLHESSFQDACPVNAKDRQKAKSMHIRNALVAVVSVTTDSWQRERQPFGSILETLLDMDPRLRGAEDAIRQRMEQPSVDLAVMKHRREDQRAAAMRSDAIERDEPAPDPSDAQISSQRQKRLDDIEGARERFWTNTKFGGTFHCETIIMSAMALLKMPGYESKMTGKQWLEYNGIFGLETSLLTLLRNPIALLNVSKRCCPACWKMFNLMFDSEVSVSKQLRVGVPGYHSRWSSVALPPFMPRDLVVKNIQYAKDEAVKRLNTLLDYIEAEETEKQRSSGLRATAEGSSPGANPPESEPEDDQAPATDWPPHEFDDTDDGSTYYSPYPPHSSNEELSSGAAGADSRARSPEMEKLNKKFSPTAESRESFMRIYLSSPPRDSSTEQLSGEAHGQKRSVDPESGGDESTPKKEKADDT